MAEANNIRLTQLCGSHEATCEKIYGYFTDIIDELYLLGAITALALGPQLLTYVLSGIFGAATAPRLVWQVEQFIVWSFIKFVAGLGGAFVARPVAKLAMLKADELDDISDLVAGVIVTTGAFTYALVQCFISDNWPKNVTASDKWLGRQIGRLHRFFTRNARKE